MNQYMKMKKKKTKENGETVPVAVAVPALSKQIWMPMKSCWCWQWAMNIKQIYWSQEVKSDRKEVKYTFIQNKEKILAEKRKRTKIIGIYQSNICISISIYLHLFNDVYKHTKFVGFRI